MHKTHIVSHITPNSLFRLSVPHDAGSNTIAPISTTQEIRTQGHADKKDASWWPALETPDYLIGILTTIIWVASGHHAAVNFGQYDFAGYFPNRPTITRMNIPMENPNDREKEEFLKKPEEFLLRCFPSQVHATIVMAILDVLSTNSPDEEYLGEKIQTYWKDDKYISAIFEQFTGRLKEIEGIIDAKNNNFNLKNRFGAGIVPYQLLKPFCEEGVTGKGKSEFCSPLTKDGLSSAQLDFRNQGSIHLLR